MARHAYKSSASWSEQARRLARAIAADILAACDADVTRGVRSRQLVDMIAQGRTLYEAQAARVGLSLAEARNLYLRVVARPIYKVVDRQRRR